MRCWGIKSSRRLWKKSCIVLQISLLSYPFLEDLIKLVNKLGLALVRSFEQLLAVDNLTLFVVYVRLATLHALLHEQVYAFSRNLELSFDLLRKLLF
jgi:hypothetical protein